MKFRIEQRKNEPVDLTLLRAISKAIPLMKRREGMALANWMLAKVADKKTGMLR